LATWLREDHGVDAVHTFSLGLHGATDRRIFDLARSSAVVLLLKDADFVMLVRREGPPPQVVWVTTGNTTNSNLRTAIDEGWADVHRRLQRGDPVVELGARRGRT
jgi:predicted nuclease of predicted toxin-antitoxin system